MEPGNTILSMTWVEGLTSNDTPALNTQPRCQEAVWGTQPPPTPIMVGAVNCPKGSFYCHEGAKAKSRKTTLHHYLLLNFNFHLGQVLLLLAHPAPVNMSPPPWSPVVLWFSSAVARPLNLLPWSSVLEIIWGPHHVWGSVAIDSGERWRPLCTERLGFCWPHAGILFGPNIRGGAVPHLFQRTIQIKWNWN